MAPPPPPPRHQHVRAHKRRQQPRRILSHQHAVLQVVQELKSLSQLVFVSSIAISQHDRIAVFQAGDELATVQFESTVASFYVVRFVVLAVLTAPLFGRGWCSRI